MRFKQEQERNLTIKLGYANAKIFLQRLNTYGVTRKEFMDAITDISKKIENNEVD